METAQLVPFLLGLSALSGVRRTPLALLAFAALLLAWVALLGAGNCGLGADD